MTPQSKTLAQLARDLDAFAFDCDPYEYKDQTDDREQAVQDVYSLLLDGEIEPLCKWLCELIEEEEDNDVIIRANALLERVQRVMKHPCHKRYDLTYLLDHDIIVSSIKK